MEDDKCRHHLDEHHRQHRRGVARNRRRGAVEPERRLDRRRGSGQRAVVLLREGRLQVDGRGGNVAVHGTAGFPPHRAHRDSPDESRHRVRRGDRAPVFDQFRARHLQDHRRREDVEEDALRQRRRRRDRSRDEPQQADACSTRRCTTSSAWPWEIRESGPESGVYKSEDGGETWKRLAGGLPDGQDRPHRPRPLSEEPATSSTRSSRTRIPKPGAETARRERHQPARRRHHRQRAVSHRRRREVVAEGDRRERRRRQGAVLVQPDPDQPARRPDRDRDERLDVHLARRRQDVEHRFLPRRVRRLPRDVVGPAGQGSRHHGQRRRRQRIGGRRKDRRLLPQHGRRRGVRRSASTWTTRTTSTAACRITIRGRARATDRPGASRSRTGSPSAPATACTTSSIRPTAAGSTTRAS